MLTKKITKTVKLLNESFPASIPLSELAALCGCSVTYLTQTFRRYMGTSIHNYVTDRRLETAHHLIKSGRSVADACYQCGFSDCSRFILLYKQRYGVTPGKSKRSKNADASIPGPSTKEALWISKIVAVIFHLSTFLRASSPLSFTQYPCRSEAGYAQKT